MSIRLYGLQGVPEDEISEITDRLLTNGIRIYKTPDGYGGGWSSIWLHDESQLTEARKLLDNYHRERAKKTREEWKRQHKKVDTWTTIVKLIKERPYEFTFILLIISIVVVMLIFGVRHPM